MPRLAVSAVNLAFTILPDLAVSARKHHTTSVVLLAAFTWLGTMVMLRHAHRLASPISHARLAVSAVSLAFTILPDLAVSARKHHHPSQFADPIMLSTWLRAYDPTTQTIPLWSTGR